MKLSDDVLMAYADNELDEKARAAVQAAMARDPELARRVAQHRALRERLRAAFEPVLDEPVPERLRDLARNTAAATPSATESNVIALPRRVARRAPLPRWVALAASVLLGFLAGWIVTREGGTGPIVTRHGHMMARGPLAAALYGQLAATQHGTGPVRIGVSFRSKSGEYCRTFTLRAPAVAGLACHAADGWRLQALSSARAADVAAGGYRQAASSLPAAIVAAVNEQIAGQALDARAEATARERGWQR